MDFARNHRGSGSNHHSRSSHDGHHHHHHRDRERERERDYPDMRVHAHHHSSSGHRHHHSSSSREHYRNEGSRGSHNHYETSGHHPPPPPPPPPPPSHRKKKFFSLIQEDHLMTNKSETDRRRIVAHITAGLCAGIVSRTATAPLDRLKVISQVSGKNVMPIEGIRMMLKEGGFWSMWRGNFANVLKVAPEVSARFFVYNEMKLYLSSQSSDQGVSTWQRVLSGFVAGASSHALIHPLEVCKTRLVLRNTGDEHRLLYIAKRGYQNSGVRFFFKGFKSSLLGIALFACIDFATYEKLKAVFSLPSGQISHLWKVLFCGTCSSLIGIVMCFPIALIGVNLMAADQGLLRSDVFKFIKTRGFLGMYSGLSAAVIKGVPTYAISYVTYEQVIHHMGFQMI